MPRRCDSRPSQLGHWWPCSCQRYIRDDVGGEVAGVIRVSEVVVLPICTNHEVGATPDRIVRDGAYVQADWRRRSGDDSSVLQLSGRGETELLRTAQRVGQLDLVDIQVAADDHEQQLTIGDVEDGLERLGGGNVQESGDVVDRLQSGRVDLFKLQGVLSEVYRLAELGLLGVGGVAALLAEDDGVFAGV